MFKKGEKIICVDASGNNNLIKDYIYTVKIHDLVNLFDLPSNLIEMGIYKNLDIGNQQVYALLLEEVELPPNRTGWRPERFRRLNPLEKLQYQLSKINFSKKNIKKEEKENDK